MRFAAIEWKPRSVVRGRRLAHGLGMRPALTSSMMYPTGTPSRVRTLAIGLAALIGCEGYIADAPKPRDREADGSVVDPSADAAGEGTTVTPNDCSSCDAPANATATCDANS